MFRPHSIRRLPLPSCPTVALLALCLAAILTPFLLAQTGHPAPAAAVEDAAQQPGVDPVPYPTLQDRIGGTWVAVWHPATGSPSAIYGTGLPLQDWREDSLDEARRHAKTVLTTFHDELRLGSSQFVEAIGGRMGQTWSFTFDQSFAGLPVIGGRADVRIHRSGALSMMGSVAWPIPADFSTTPRIGAEQAATAAWIGLGLGTPTAEHALKAGSRLVIWGDANARRLAKVHLAWEVTVNVAEAGKTPVRGRSFVDANDGSVLAYHSDIHSCGVAGCKAPHARVLDHASALALTRDLPRGRMLPPVTTTVTVRGWTRTGLSATSALSNVPLRGLEVNVPGIGTRTTDSNGQFTIDIAAPVTINIAGGWLALLQGTHGNTLSAYGPLYGGNATIQPGVAATIQLQSSSVLQNAGSPTTAHYWMDETNRWARGILGNTSQLGQLDAVTAYVDEDIEANAYAIVSPVLRMLFCRQGSWFNNFAFATVIAHEWGHLLDHVYGGISNNPGDGLSEGWGDILAMYLVDSPEVGRDWAGSGTVIRTGLNNTTYPHNPLTEQHYAGQSWMGFAWRVRENLRTAFGTTTANAVSNDIVIGSIVANATNQAAAVLEVFLADDNDANLLNGTPHHAQLSAAATAKNLPYPGRQAITFTTYGSGCSGSSASINLGAASTTWLPGTLSVRITGMSNELPIMVIGSAQVFVNLAAIGMPGCTLLARTDAIAILPAPLSGTSTCLVPVPLSSSLTGASLFFQGVAMGDISTYGMSAVSLSNGGRATVRLL